MRYLLYTKSDDFHLKPSLFVLLFAWPIKRDFFSFNKFEKKFTKFVSRFIIKRETNY